ncbi:MAG: glycosyltransferase family 39 protein, partial [Candidatus Levybacteria bacterium]|nr:glycosyltransferase family 39 protein [Candidatus Levybacteria bacterium]
MKKKLNKDFAILILIFFLGLVFRFYNLNWDLGFSFHPDERNIAAAVSRIHFFDKLNPEFFAYGSLPVYLYRAGGDFLVYITKDTDWVYNWGDINLIGRYFSAIFSSLTIPFIYLLSKKIFNKEVALISTFLSAFCVGIIQTAHFSVTESILMFSVVLITLLSINIINKPLRKRNYIALGIVFGLSLASKISAISFLSIPAVTYFLSVSKKEIVEKTLFFFLFLIISFVIFTTLAPYTFLNFDKFLESMRYEGGVAIGSLPVVYTLQFDNTLPYLFQLKNLFWQMGIAAPFSVIGVVVILYEAVMKKSYSKLVFISFPIIYFAYVGTWHTKFIRYMDPLLPFLIIAGSYFLFLLKNKFKFAGKLLFLSVLILTFVWSVSFMSIYSNKQTRIAASEWIYENIPQESLLLTEHWDDRLPLVLPEKNIQYRIEQLSIYDPDSQDKITYYSEKLSSADYIVINSKRLYGTLLYLEEKYPITSNYYK